MKYYKTLSFIMFSFLLLSCEHNRGSIPRTEDNANYIAYYFHPAARCESCLNLESYVKELIETKYSKNTFIFKSINIDEEENEHFKKDYDLKFSSVILVRFENGAQKRWKNLDSVWSFTENKEQFFRYTEKEILNFIMD